MDHEKKSTSYRLTPEALRLISSLGKRLGLANASILELAVRELAAKYDLAPRRPPASDPGWLEKRDRRSGD
jgi:hypothetical protein